MARSGTYRNIWAWTGSSHLAPRGTRFAHIAQISNEIILDVFRRGAGGALSTSGSLPLELAVSGVCGLALLNLSFRQ